MAYIPFDDITIGATLACGLCIFAVLKNEMALKEAGKQALRSLATIILMLFILVAGYIFMVG